MPTTISCPHCGKSYRFEDKYDGKIVRCRGCRDKFEIDLTVREGLVVFDVGQAVSIDSLPLVKSNELSVVKSRKQGSISAVQTRHTDQIVCPKCTTANNINTRFCVGCGTQLFTTCPECEQEIPVDVMHCGKCGVHVGQTRQQKHIASLREAIITVLRLPGYAWHLVLVVLVQCRLCRLRLARGFRRRPRG